MPVDTYTNEVMRALPSALRPNPWSIDEEVMNLVTRGWKPIEIAEATVRDGATNPALAVHTIRRLKDYPAPSEKLTRTTRPVGHQPCPQHEGCELCACDPEQGVIHHRPVPMPDWFRERFAPIMRAIGNE